MATGQKQNFIKGFVSSEGEHISLSTAVSILPTDQPELWLNRFDTAHRETLRNQLLKALKIRGDGCLKPIASLLLMSLCSRTEQRLDGSICAFGSLAF